MVFVILAYITHTKHYACTSRPILPIVHYIDVIMTTIVSQITSLTVVYSPVYSDADQRKHQSTASLAFVWGIHRDRWIPRTKGQFRGKCFHLMTSSCLRTTSHAADLLYALAPFSSHESTTKSLYNTKQTKRSKTVSLFYTISKQGPYTLIIQTIACLPLPCWSFICISINIDLRRGRHCARGESYTEDDIFPQVSVLRVSQWLLWNIFMYSCVCYYMVDAYP